MLTVITYFVQRAKIIHRKVLHLEELQSHGWTEVFPSLLEDKSHLGGVHKMQVIIPFSQWHWMGKAGSETRL